MCETFGSLASTINDTGKMLGAWKARYKWCISQTMQNVVRSLRKLTYLVCVQWNEFLTGQDIVIQIIVQFLNTQECTLLASSYIFYFNVLFCLSVYKKYAITDRHFWLNMHGLMQLFILKIIDLFLVRNFSDKFHNIYQKPDEIKWKSNPFSKKLWQK